MSYHAGRSLLFKKNEQINREGEIRNHERRQCSVDLI